MQAESIGLYADTEYLHSASSRGLLSGFHWYSTPISAIFRPGRAGACRSVRHHAGRPSSPPAQRYGYGTGSVRGISRPDTLWRPVHVAGRDVGCRWRFLRVRKRLVCTRSLSGIHTGCLRRFRAWRQVPGGCHDSRSRPASGRSGNAVRVLSFVRCRRWRPLFLSLALPVNISEKAAPA